MRQSFTDICRLQRRGSWIVTIMVLAYTALLPGCQTILNVEDVIAPPGTPVQLTAHVDRQTLLFTSPMRNIPVYFYCDGKPAGVDRTDGNGTARLRVSGGTHASEYQAIARTRWSRLQDQGRVFAWARGRPLIAIDLDETMMRSRYVGMLLLKDDPSPPRQHAREVISALARQYGIIYISARARVFRKMTWRWLERHGFPPGPIELTNSVTQVFRQDESKKELLTTLRRYHPGLRTGIGDKLADEYAFVSNNMVPVIINRLHLPRWPRTYVLSDWKAVADLLLDSSPAPGAVPPLGFDYRHATVLGQKGELHSPPAESHEGPYQ